MSAPSKLRCVAFFDAQNLYHSAKREFGYNFPNCHPVLLAEAVAHNAGWQLVQTRFYTGIPVADRTPRWHSFWTSKLGHLHDESVVVFSRPLVYSGDLAREKGIDVRISLDVIRLAMKREFEVALLFSQDLSEVAKDIREIAHEQQRWIKIASAFPLAPGSTHTKGVNFTDWLPIDKSMYDRCLDPRDYRPTT